MEAVGGAKSLNDMKRNKEQQGKDKALPHPQEDMTANTTYYIVINCGHIRHQK